MSDKQLPPHDREGNSTDYYSRDCLLPKSTRKEQRSEEFKETAKRIFWEVMEENSWKLEDFAVEETKDG